MGELTTVPAASARLQAGVKTPIARLPRHSIASQFIAARLEAPLAPPDPTSYPGKPSKPRPHALPTCLASSPLRPACARIALTRPLTPPQEAN